MGQSNRYSIARLLHTKVEYSLVSSSVRFTFTKGHLCPVRKRDYYLSDIYKTVHYSGFLSRFTAHYHKDLEIPFTNEQRIPNVLEIGGGSGEHFPWVKHDFVQYISIDVFDHESEVKDSRFIPQVGDASAIAFSNDYFDRAISTCVLHHIATPHKALQELRRVVKSGGYIDLYVPHDPGVLYRSIRHFASHHKQARESNKSMKEIKYLWSQEHLNHFPGLKYAIRKIFEEDEIKEIRRPFPLITWNLNFYSIFRIKVKK